MNPEITNHVAEKSAVQPSRPALPVAEPSVARGEATGSSGLTHPPQRWRAKRKAEVVLRLLRGEPFDLLSRQTAVPVPRLEEWRTQALGGIEAALQLRDATDPAQLRLD